MRPYLAVISDSFRAALSSRVLWIAFIAIWILLALLAPLGYEEDYTSTIRWRDFNNGTKLKAMLAQGLVDPNEEMTALGRLAAAMPESLQRQLRNVGKDEQRIYTSALADGLNSAIADESWYDAEAWQKTARLKELRDLDAMPANELSDSLRRRRARLRIEAALPGVFESRPSRSVMLKYAGFKFPAVFAVGKEQFGMLANQFVLPIVMEWLLGFVLIFLGILVTASIVPDMLQPGSLHLLLSKPVGRTFLLLSKFIGGCSFVILCVCQLVIGLWLILGLRLDLWNIRLLWCIPVSVFIFSVFYSVSVFAGLRWRSPILAIGVTCLFGAFLMVVGVLAGYFDQWVRRPAIIRSLVMTGDTAIAVTRGADLLKFDNAAQTWAKLIDSSESSRSDFILSPVRLDDDHVLSALARGGRFNPFGTGAPDLMVMDEDDAWNPEPSMRLPVATRKLLVVKGKLIAVNTGGILQAEHSVLSPPESEDSVLLDQVASLMRIQGNVAAGFRSILPAGVGISRPVRTAVAKDGNSLMVYSHGQLIHLEPGEAQSPWRIIAKRDLDGDGDLPASIAVSGDQLLVAREDKTLVLDTRTLETEHEFVETLESVVQAIGIENQQEFLVLTANGQCQRVAVDSEPSAWNEFTEVESLTWDPDAKQILVVHHLDEVSVVDPETMQEKFSLRPKPVGWRFVDRYLVTTLRNVVPQTGELSDTVAALISGKSAIAFGQDDATGGGVIRRRVLRPVISCSIFIAIMLTLSCVYFARKDF